MKEFTITRTQLKKLFDYLSNKEREGTFRYLIYDVMGLKPENYSDMYSTGLMGFKDEIYDLRSELKLKNKALEYIEKLCYVYENSDKSDLKNTQNIIDSIYRYTHCVQKKHKCYDVHEDWRIELLKQNWEI